jgi:hypothetical protein
MKVTSGMLRASVLFVETSDKASFGAETGAHAFGSTPLQLFEYLTVPGARGVDGGNGC